MKTRNHVARVAWKFNKAKVIPNKKKEAQRKACRRKDNE